MIASALTLALAGIAAATPLTSRGVAPKLSKSKGFHLVLNVTDPAEDFSPSVHGTYVVSIHTGAGFARAGSGSKDSSRIFYQNGTAEQQASGHLTLISDGATPPTPQPFSFSADADANVNDVNMNLGEGTAGIQLEGAGKAESWVWLLPETYLACDTPLQYYQGNKFVTIEQTSNGTAFIDADFKCTAIRLLPECTKLPSLPDDATSSHDFAIESQCYEDVSAIDWTLS